MNQFLLAHATCAVLVLLDLGARSWRLRILSSGAGHPLTLRDALRVNLLADAGASLSPMRLAGEPARIAGLSLTGAPMPAIAATIGWELLTAWPTLLLITSALVVVAAPEWWNESGPLLLGRAADAMPLLIALGVLLIGAWLAGRRLQALLPTRARERVVPFAECWRAMPARALLASVPLSAINVLTRTALLPALVLGLPSSPPAEVVWFGSFLLVYGQLVLPTPSGAGAVELGLLGGAAGAFDGGVEVLLGWRWWASIVPTLGGVWVAWQARRGLVRLLPRRAPAR